jgi:hypothetical protein
MKYVTYLAAAVAITFWVLIAAAQSDFSDLDAQCAQNLKVSPAEIYAAMCARAEDNKPWTPPNKPLPGNSIIDRLRQ